MAFDFNKGIPFQQQGVTPQKRPSISNIIEQEAAQKVKTGSLAEKIGFTNTKVGAAGQKVFNAFTSTAQKLGTVLGQDAAAPEAVNLYKNAAAEYEKTSNDILETIRKAQSEGRDTTRLMAAFKTIKPPKMSDFVTPEMTQALEKTPEQIAGLVGGTALEALSGGAFQSGAKTVVSKSPAWMKLLRLTGESAGYGGVYGATQAMQENKDFGGIVKDTAINSAIGAGVGLTVGLGVAGVGAANKALVARRANQLVKASNEVDRLAGQIAQAKPDDIPAITRSLGEIDATDVKSYSDLAEAIDQQIEGLSTKLDDGLDTVVGTKTLDQLETTVTRGKTTIKSNPVAEALDQLEEFYISTNNKEKQAAISEIRRKAQTEGLTVKELNNLARLHGQDINAFYASGQAASGLTQQAAENTRKAIKSTARELFGNPLYAEVDQKISELLTTRTLVEKMVNSVQAIQNKVVPRNFTQKVGNAIANLIDTMSGGAAKSFIQRFVKSGNVNKVDALGLEKILQKNLKKMQELLKKSGTMSERDLIKELEQLNEQLLYPALPSGESKPTGSFVPRNSPIRPTTAAERQVIPMPSSAREVNSGMNEVKDATIKSTKINPKDKTEYVRNQKTGEMEIIPSKTQPKKKINSPKKETLYHGTSVENAASIKNSGFSLTAKKSSELGAGYPENFGRKAIYLTRDLAEATGYSTKARLIDHSIGSAKQSLKNYNETGDFEYVLDMLDNKILKKFFKSSKIEYSGGTTSVYDAIIDAEDADSFLKEIRQVFKQAKTSGLQPGEVINSQLKDNAKLFKVASEKDYYSLTSAAGGKGRIGSYLKKQGYVGVDNILDNEIIIFDESSLEILKNANKTSAIQQSSKTLTGNYSRKMPYLSKKIFKRLQTVIDISDDLSSADLQNITVAKLKKRLPDTPHDELEKIQVLLSQHDSQTDTYLYHISSAENIQSIVDKGLTVNDRKKLFFDIQVDDIFNIVNDNGNAGLFRLRTNQTSPLKFSYRHGPNNIGKPDNEEFGISFRKSIPRENIEVFTNDGWVNLQDFSNGQSKSILNKQAGFISPTKAAIIAPLGTAGIVAYNKLAKKFGVVEYDAESPVSTSDEETIAIPDRNIQISTSSIDDIVKPILFGELSNRPIEKKELEVRVILNTALNRIKQLKDKGKEVSLEEVLTAPNQYQAYDGEQYNNYISDELDSLGIKKKEELDVIMEKVLNELKAGTFKDNTRGAVFYVHEEDGRITFDSTKKLFK